ncbi:hypothetical protein ACFO1B_12840 [Dactylosporangium siamense]|uniref:DUF2975 domain-containing protein n=1 Tax=Dactylosporangium siamense TaxID=685454 RepID=A0A919PR90_9ACTN|nr:hypothetical protein [Dactylosporangium siamense]GIG49171.1 hypothetical protein Dsi01nite_072120 [Dactylosporangium siamense]
MPATRHPANPLMLLAGLLLIIVGIVVMVGGFAWAVLTVLGLADRTPQLSDLGAGPHAREDLGPMLDGFAVFVVGTTVMTIGRYLWRGARRRGWRDRLGRLLLIITCLAVGSGMVVLTRFVLAAMDESDGGGTILRGLFVFALIGVPASLLGMVGLRLADEEILMTAEARASL